MFDLELYAAGLAAALGMAIGGWLVSIAQRDVSVVDSLWSLFFLALVAVYVITAPAAGERAHLALFLVGVWAVRLSLYITLRNRGQGEDRRYQAIRRHHEPGFWWKSLYLIFGFQAILAWIISLPLLGAVLAPAPLNWLDYAAVCLWLLGLFFEAVGDQQLAEFRRDPRNRDRVMDQGLWRYTRHPNYFGEACIWWGFGLLALAGGAWWGLLGPLLMTILLLRLSGVSLLEKDIGERRPGYREYVARTNAFLPGPPRRPTSGS